MSDIGINLSGVVALLILLASASVLGVFALVSGIVALVRGKGIKRGVISQPAFGFFSAAVALGIIDLIVFGILLFFVDSNQREINESIDKIAFYAWLPLQPIVWIASAVIFSKVRKVRIAEK